LPILAPARESVLRRELEQWWAARGIAPVIRAEFDDAAAMFELAAAGLGAAPVHEPVLRGVCKRYGLVELPVRCDIKDELFVVAEIRQYASEGVALLMSLAKTLLAE
jgi:DNA-binding transcriptional LysR family regulator